MVIALEVPAHIPHPVVSVIEGSIFSSGRVQPHFHCRVNGGMCTSVARRHTSPP